MKTSIEYGIWPRDLDFKKLFNEIEKFALKRKMQRGGINFFAINVDPSEEATADSLEEFQTLCKSTPKLEEIHSQQMFVKKDVWLIVNVTCRGNLFRVSVDAVPDVVRLLHEELRSDFGLKKRPIPLADTKRATYPQPTVFLGRHFDKRAGDLGRMVKEFLYLLGIDVVEGEPYEAQRIPLKVESLIDGKEIYIGLVTKNPEHDWITAEVAYARGKGKQIIVIVEEGSNFNPTILGRDFEQIRFSGDRIEEAFTKLLREFRNIGIRIS
jgi:hypothetical protein